jgi:DNA repair exonuclease SbcCD ATPase subunit
VWIERVDVRGFRGLSGQFAFSPMLTLVIGDNEAGKSSLHEALVRTIFGFSRVERRRSRGSSLLERRAPWHGGPYGLVAHLRNGERSYRVEWDYAKHRVAVVDDLGRDLSEEIGGGRDDVELGEFFLGVGVDDFRQVCCIDQDELSAVRSSPTLGVALQEAVAKVGGGVPVEHAVERLNDYLRSIGARTDNLRPSPAGRLMALQREHAQLRGRLREAEDAREEIERSAREAALAHDELRRLEVERDRLRQRLLAEEAQELEQRLAEARRLDQQSRDRPHQIPTLTAETVEQARLAQTRMKELESELAMAEQPAETALLLVAELEAQQRALATSVGERESYAAVDTSARDDVRTGLSQLEQLTADAEEVTRRLAEAANGRTAVERVDGPESIAVEDVRLARARITELEDERASADSAAGSAAARVEELERDQRAVQTAVDGLEAYAGVDPSARDEVREGWAQLEALAATSAPSDAERFAPDAELAAYRADRDTLLAVTGAPEERSQGRRWLRIALDVLTLGIAWLVRRLLRRRRETRATAAFSERLQRYGGASVEELDARVAEEDRKLLQVEAASEALRRSHAESEQRRTTLAAHLQAALDRVDAPHSVELGERVRAYLTAVERYEHLANQRAKLAVVQRELEQARQPLRDQRRLLQEHERAVLRLREAYTAVGIDEHDLTLAADSFERLVAAAEQARAREQRVRATTVELQRAQAEVDERRRILAVQVETALDRIGAAPAPELRQRAQAYLEAVDCHEELSDQQAKLAHVERALEQARLPLREQSRLMQEHERVVTRLRTVYAAAGIHEDDLTAARDVFERLVAATDDARAREQRASAAGEALRSLIADETVELLESRAADARRRYDEHVRNVGELAPGDQGTREHVSAELASLDDRVRIKIGEAHALEARVAQREEQAGDPAPLKEQIAAIEAQLARLNEAKKAVALARSVLEEAADELRREFAPHLNEALERNLARVTGGRYTRAYVDGELNVQVEIQDGGLKPADELSRATKDQLFLIERLVIARLLGPTKGASPLLLDDPFAHYDRTRLRRGLEVVLDAAEERQVVVFSEDRDLIGLARDLREACTVIELPSP